MIKMNVQSFSYIELQRKLKNLKKEQFVDLRIDKDKNGYNYYYLIWDDKQDG